MLNYGRAEQEHKVYNGCVSFVQKEITYSWISKVDRNHGKLRKVTTEKSVKLVLPMNYLSYIIQGKANKSKTI